MSEKHGFFQGRLKSFHYAFNGLKLLLREEPNSLIHLLSALAVIILGFFFKISTYEWIAVALCIGFVLAMETVNTSIENICDLISTERDERIKKIKDIAAAGVLISSISAFTVGLLIFIPKIF